uniref:Plasmodium yoelii subtelomeric region (PYST-C1) n=1 Tax=Elaeophora elaphi TaxID=1147741 RepID=A0A0R3RTR2_9BILA
MHSLRMVVFLFTVLWDLSIAVNYNRNTEDFDRRRTDRRFHGDEIAEYHNDSMHSHGNIDSNYEDVTYTESGKKSFRRDMFEASKRFKVSYPSSDSRFFRSMLDKDLCYQYTSECIYYRSEYPNSKLLLDPKTSEEYNPCHRFVEPCFGISEYDYKTIKKFKNLRDY